MPVGLYFGRFVKPVERENAFWLVLRLTLGFCLSSSKM